MSTDFTLRASKSDNIFNPNEFKYLLYKNESKFNYKDFKLNKSNFEAWYEALMRHLIAQNLDSFITRELNINSRDLLMGDNATQSIIVESIDNNSKLYLKGCKTAYQMINRLKNRYYMSGETLLNELINKINKLKIIDNDYLAYMNELKSLYEQHDQESGRLNKTLMGDEVKTHKAGKELLKVGFNELQLKSFKTFEILYNNIVEAYDYKESCNRDNEQYNSDKEDKINYISNKSKSKSFINKEFNSDDYCLICKNHGHTLEN
eukprot:jgi/Orpsp1_1/1176903/evm.model.c7180000059444.1